MERAFFSPADPKASSSDVRISPRPSAGSTAYAEAGAECVYAPGLRAKADIAAVVSAVAPTPVNVLVGSDFATVAELAGVGVRRISVGGALARAAWNGFLQAAREIAEHGTFTNLARAVPFAEVERIDGVRSEV